MKKSNLIYSPALAILVCLTFMLPQSRASQVKTIAVIPFEINASKDMPHVSQGLVNMFYARLSWQDHTWVMPPSQVNKKIAGLDEPQSVQIQTLSQKLDSDYILTGSITELAGSFSIDARIFDMANKRYMAFFEQSDNGDELIAKLDRIAAAINKKVFDRTTLTWDQIEQEQQAAINDAKRKNPEYLMQQNPQWQKTEEKVGWKVWKYLF